MSPIQIDVYINDDPIKTYHVGRLSASLSTEPDAVNLYGIQETEFGEPYVAEGDWDTFSHRYGAGIDVCIYKALRALLGESA